MRDIDQALVSAWERIKVGLLNDPAELRRRAARRNMPSVNMPPRCWCLAVRAGDTRLGAAAAEVDPEEATRKGCEARHEVTLDRAALVQLCDLVKVDGMTLDVAAAALGVNKQNLLHARLKGTFEQRYVPGLGGRWGKPRPVLYTKGLLDPCIRGFAVAEEAWSYTGRLCLSSIPKAFEQRIVRVPHVQNVAGRRYRDTTGLHPEHPDVDRDVMLRRPRRSKRLPPPPPDYVAYKWKGDEFVGYDWRAAETNPRIRENYERHQRKLTKARAAKKARRRASPPPSQASGSNQFKGWRWKCPACGRAVQVIFLPMSRRNLATRYPCDRDELRRRGVEAEPAWPTGVLGFACARCHRVRCMSRGGRDFWNDLVTYLSCGLLYGSEVPRPAWVTKQRKRPYAPRPNAPPAWRRLRVQELLLRGWSYKRIAAEMKIHWHTVMTHATKIYQQYGVHGRYELARRVGVKLARPVTKGQQIRARLSAGQSYAQIAREMGIGRRMVSAYVSAWRRRGIAGPAKRHGCVARKDVRQSRTYGARG